MKVKNILIVAELHEEYYYLPFVQECKGRNVVIHILDPSRFPEKATVSVRCKGIKINGFIDVVRYDTDGRKDCRLSISEVDLAWYLRTSAAPQEQGAASTLERRFARNESVAALRSLLSVLPCRWVNKMESIDSLLSNKLYQQVIASSCGLLTPDTLISNDPVSVSEFSNPNKGLLLKSLGYTKLDEERRYFLYSQRFTYKELEEAGNAIRQCPIFSQEYVDKKCEHRVMVIGDTVLSCKIDSQASEQTKTDWRHYDFEKVAHTQSQLPTSVQNALKDFMRKVALRYGAIDLIETPENNFVFLEVNPSGQWGWIHDFAQLPIPKAVADLLESA